MQLAPADGASASGPEIELIIEGEREELERLLGAGAKGADSERSDSHLTPAAVNPQSLDAALRNAQLLARALRKAPTKPRTHTVRSGGRCRAYG